MGCCSLRCNRSRRPTCGALTLGTLDGANVEILDEVGKDNIIIFGLTAEEVAGLKPHYNPRDYCNNNPMLKRVLDLVSGGFFSTHELGLFQPIVDNLLSRDPYLVLADFQAYCDAQDRVDQSYRDREAWTQKAILNIARSGKFSSDRTILEYNRDIWNAKPMCVTREKK